MRKRKSPFHGLVLAACLALGCAAAIGSGRSHAAPAEETEAAAGPTYSITQDQIISGGSFGGSYDIWSWQGIDFYGDPKRTYSTGGNFISAYHANLAYASKVTVTLNVISWDSSSWQIYFLASGTSAKRPLKMGLNTYTWTSVSADSFFQFYISRTGGTEGDFVYFNGNGSTPMFKIETVDPTRTVSITAGTGVKSVYLNTNSTATSGAGTSFKDGDKVYGFATLKAGYKHPSSWTKVSGTEDAENAIYRTGSITVSSTSTSLGTVSADPKTKTIYRADGNVGHGSVTLTYDASSASVPAISKSGYTFKNWNTAKDGSGTSYGTTLSTAQLNSIILSNVTTLYAQWTANSYTVTLDKNGGTGGQNSVTATYGQAMPALSSVPTREGYTFGGYNRTNAQSEVETYYNAEGKSARTWNVASNATLKAIWNPIPYSVLLAKGTGVNDVYLSSNANATSGSSSGAKFGYGTTVYAFAKLERGYKPQSGWVKVSGTADVGGAIYRVASKTVALGDGATDFGTIDAVLGNYGVNIVAGIGVQEVLLSAKEDGTNLVAAGSTFPYGSSVYGYAKLAVGYEAPAAWGDPISGEPATAGTLYKVGALQSVDVSDSSLGEIVASPKHYAISLEGLEGPFEATYDAYLPDLAELPVREGYTFTGYYDAETAGIQYIDETGHGVKAWDKDQDDATLYPQWTKDMIYVATGYEADYDGEFHTVSVTVTDPESATVKYGTALGVYDLDEAPTYKNVGTYTVYYKVTATVGDVVYTTVTGQRDVVIKKVDRTAFEALMDQCGDDISEIGSSYPAIADVLSGALGDAIAFNANDNVTLAQINEAMETLQQAIDVALGDYSIARIGDIGTVEYTPESKGKIDQARSTYDSLTDEQKAKVPAEVVATLVDAEKVYGSMDKIHAIGNVEYTAASKAKIDAARAAYDALTDEQKAAVGETFLKTLVDAEKAYAVMDEIHDIGTVEYTVECKGRIDAARAAYDALDATQKAMVLNYADLVKAETDYSAVDAVSKQILAIQAISHGSESADAIASARENYDALTDDQKAFFLENTLQHLLDLEAAYAELVKIHAIGDVEYTAESKGKIDAARNGYDALSAAQKALVNGQEYQILLDAEQLYGAKDLIHAIGDVEYTEQSKDKIDDARNAYNALKPAQKALVPADEYQILLDAEQLYHAKDLIHTIGMVEYGAEEKNHIENARSAYNELNNAQKALVTEGEVKLLEDAEKTYAALEKIHAIGNVFHTTESKGKIDAARSAYDGLTEDQRELVYEEDLQILLDAEKAYAALDKIYAIGPVFHTPESKDKIDAARSAYDALSAAQKALIADADVQKLLDAEKAYDALDRIHAIGDVEYTEAELAGIQDARETYDALSEAQKALIADADVQKLVDSEKAYAELEKIYAIGPVFHTTESKAKIDAARDGYDQLSEAQKTLLSEEDVQKLLDAEAAYAELIKIDAIGDVFHTTESKGKIDAARETYDALSEAQKALICEEDVQKLLDAEKAYDALDRIYAIGDVEYTEEEKAGIDDARETYDALSDAQKALICDEDVQKLVDAERAYDSLEKIYAIGAVELTLQSQAKVVFARTTYELLSEEQKALISETDVQKLVDAEKVYAVLVEIDAIGDVSYSTESKEKIDHARSVFDSLTPHQKEMVGEKNRKTLVNAEKDYVSVENSSNVIVIVFLVLSCLLIIGGALFLCRLFIKNKKDDEGGNGNGTVKAMSVSILPVIAVLASHYGDAPFIALYVLAGIAVLLWICILCTVIARKKKAKASGPVAEEEPAEAEQPSREPVEEEKPSGTEEPEEEEPAPTAVQSFVAEAPDEAEEAEGNSFEGRYVRSFTAKMCQADDQVKSYYRTLKNHALSFKKAVSRISWPFDSINVGRSQAVKFVIKGKTLCLYLGINPDELPAKYRVEKVESGRYADVPCLYRIRGDRRCAYAKEIISLVMEKLGTVPGKTCDDDYDFPYEDDETLLAKGLIKERR